MRLSEAFMVGSGHMKKGEAAAVVRRWQRDARRRKDSKSSMESRLAAARAAGIAVVKEGG